MEKDYLTLKRAPASRPSAQWEDDDYDVLAGGEIVGRIFNSGVSVASPWMWTLDIGHTATLRHARLPWPPSPKAGGGSRKTACCRHNVNVAPFPKLLQE
jgi:hypothetical protein